MKPCIHLAFSGFEAPTASSCHSVFPLCRSFGIDGELRIVGSVPIAAPFEYVTGHIVQTDFVGIFACYATDGIIIIILIRRSSERSHIACFIASGKAVVMSTNTASRSKLPFGFGGDIDMQSGQLAHFLDKESRVFVGDETDR